MEGIPMAIPIWLCLWLYLVSLRARAMLRDNSKRKRKIPN